MASKQAKEAELLMMKSDHSSQLKLAENEFEKKREKLLNEIEDLKLEHSRQISDKEEAIKLGLGDVETKVAEIQKHVEQISKLKSEIEDKQEEIEDLTTKKKQLEDRLDMTKKKVTSLEKEIEDLGLDQADDEKQISQLQIQV